MNKPETARTSREPAKKNRLPALLLLLLAAALLAVGVLLSENGLVERNAHYLCLDCLGIG